MHGCRDKKLQQHFLVDNIDKVFEPAKAKNEEKSQTQPIAFIWYEIIEIRVKTLVSVTMFDSFVPFPMALV